MDKRREIELAEVIRKACVKEATEGFRDASLIGLCMEETMEAAVSAIQKMNIEKIVEEYSRTKHSKIVS
ncbi:MAG: acetyltransferase [Balneolaceae bacterium]